MSCWGLCFYDAQTRRNASLPLVRVRASASINELSAQVKVTQTFSNDLSKPIQASYVFPVPARAAVCAFTMIKQSGVRIVGKVQAKEEAKKTYEAAVAQGKTASLAVQQTADVFQISVGNIASNEQVDIELIYATELTEDEDTDSIRFHIPVHIGARYGQAPTTAPSAPSDFVDLRISVEAVAPIRKISCPSHTISTEVGPDPSLPNVQEMPFSNYARVSLTSSEPLGQDFVLAIQSAGLDKPRCVAELHPTQDTVALSLTLVPRFTLPDTPNQEFIFLVDRSGSMGGKRIEAAKKALVILLRSLPRKNATFQIASFGTNVTFLWEDGSRLYNQEALDEATKHVDEIRANYGGTEVRNALVKCFKQTQQGRATSVFVLTDGDAWDLDGVVKEVKNAVRKKETKLRVFCLGIGNSASTAMCEGIARVGEGACMMVGEQEASMTGKIARMIKAARMPVVKDVEVDWGRHAKAERKEETHDKEEDFELVEQEEAKQQGTKKLNVFDESVDHMATDVNHPTDESIVLPPPAEIQQSPVRITRLFSGIRLYVYAILQGKAQIPRNVTLRGRTEDGADIELPVEVKLSKLPNESDDAPPAVHALAASKIVQDYEDRVYDDPSAFDASRVRNAHIVRLGRTYSITTSQTSFVAVDEQSQPIVNVEQAPTAPKPGGGAMFGSASASFAGAPRLMKMGAPPPAPTFSSITSAAPTPAGAGLFGGASFGGTSFAAEGGGSSLFGAASSSSGIPPQLAPPTQAGLFGSAPSLAEGGASLFGAASSSQAQDSQAAPTVKSFASRKRAAASPSIFLDFEAAIPDEASDPLEQLARLQAFDGGFSAARLDELVGVTCQSKEPSDIKAMFPVELEDGVIATLLAKAYIDKMLREKVKEQDRAAWESILEKAVEYLDEVLGGNTGNMKDLMDIAEGAVL